jgi:long-chain acyl-CoA synthetase
VTGYWCSWGAAPIVTTNPLGAPPKPGSVGRARPGDELRLVDADGRPVEPDDDDGDGGDSDLVALRGPNLFSGYWPDGAAGPDADGRFRTADVGFVDADADLHLVDRSSDVVIVNGFNVYPREVERVLLSIEGVTEAAVVGQRDERAGEVVKAVLVTDPAADGHEDGVRAFCAQRLARFKVPAVIVFVDALPRTSTGKIARRQLALS